VALRVGEARWCPPRGAHGEELRLRSARPRRCLWYAKIMDVGASAAACASAQPNCADDLRAWDRSAA